MGMAGALGITVALAGIMAGFFGISRLLGRGMKARVAQLEHLEPPPLDESLDVTLLPLVYFQQWGGYGNAAKYELRDVAVSEVRGRRLLTCTFRAGLKRAGGGYGRGSDAPAHVAVTEVPRDWGHLVVVTGAIAPQWRAYLGAPLGLGLDRFERRNTIFGDEAFARSVLTPAFTEWWATMPLDQMLEINRGVAVARLTLPPGMGDRPAHVGRFLIQAIERMEAERQAEAGRSRDSPGRGQPR